MPDEIGPPSNERAEDETAQNPAHRAFVAPRVNHPPPFTNEDPVWLTIPNDPRNARYAMIIADSKMDNATTMSYQLKNSSGVDYKVGGQVVWVKADQLKKR